jgi:hypothetical protein
MRDLDRLYAKFQVKRTDERDLPGGDKADARYFVLDYIHDRFARVALAAYADACQSVLPGLAQDLRRRLAWSETTIVAGPEAKCACPPEHDHAYPYGCRAQECQCTYFPEQAPAENPWAAGAVEPTAEPGWPEGGRVAGEWLTCAGCADEIWPTERVYSSAAGGVLCAVCEVGRQQAAERDARRQAPSDTRPYSTGGEP